jgi:hypothetical protein
LAPSDYHLFRSMQKHANLRLQFHYATVIDFHPI